MNDQMRKALHEQFLALTSDTWDFRIKGEQGDPVRTFSREALQATVDAIGIFVAARVGKRWTDTGLAPRELSVRVSVDIS
jgi:hypothetical protein